ncbi:MAG: rod shape-determining protein RodA [Rikenellaceae bacterium]
MRERHFSVDEGSLGRVDRVSIILFTVIALIGCISVFSSSYEATTESFLSFSHNYVKQVVWLGISMIVGFIVLLIDTNFIYKYSYPLYIAGVILLMLTLLFGREVNGAKAWFEFGFFRVQPVEVVKITTSLALARVLSDNNFSITSLSGLSTIGTVLAIPLLIIVLQNDTGSGIVFGSLLFVLYREGLSKWLTIPPIIIATIFALSLIVTPVILLLAIMIATMVIDASMSNEYHIHISAFAAMIIVAIVLSLGSYLIIGSGLTAYHSLVIVCCIVAFAALIHSLIHSLRQRIAIIGISLITIALIPLSNYIFEDILRPHQQNRIMSFLGIVNDPLGSDYNVNQAKIAIGSGGVWGKGFLEGTQIRYGFVPERHTDFIFCSVGEEWGFVGSLILLACFGALILRLMHIGEMQNNIYSRVYCYCVASILLFHLFVNVGMTIGLFPVMGIPLPMVSYGGSSLLAFTVMIFIAIRMSANIQRKNNRH